MRYRSAMVLGSFATLHGGDKERALQVLAATLLPGLDGARPPSAKELRGDHRPGAADRGVVAEGLGRAPGGRRGRPRPAGVGRRRPAAPHVGRPGAGAGPARRGSRCRRRSRRGRRAGRDATGPPTATCRSGSTTSRRRRRRPDAAAAAVRRRHGGRRDRRRRLHRAVDGVLPAAVRPLARRRRGRARDRRVRRERAQRRLVLGAVPGVPGEARPGARRPGRDRDARGDAGHRRRGRPGRRGRGHRLLLRQGRDGRRGPLRGAARAGAGAGRRRTPSSAAWTTSALLAAEETRERVGREPASLGGLYTPHCARIHPARLVRGLARAVERRGGRIAEGTAATSVAPGRVVTDRGTVRARRRHPGHRGLDAAAARRRGATPSRCTR